MFDVFDLISKRTVENFRTAFIEETGMTLSFSDTEHKQYDTFYSGNKCEFCRLMNADPHGLEHCICSSKYAGKKAAKQQKPLIYRCHAGLSEIVVPILTGGKHVGNVYSGQVLTKIPSESEFDALAVNLQRENLYVEGLREAYLNIPVVPEWKLKVFAKLLSIIVDYMIETEMNTALEAQILLEKEKLNQLKPYVRNEFANYISGNHVEKLIDIREKLDFLGLHRLPNTLLLCRLDQYEELYGPQDERFRARMNDLVLHVIEDCVNGLEETFVHAMGDGLFLILLSPDCEPASPEEKKLRGRIAGQICQSVKARTSFTCSAGIGNTSFKSIDLGSSYRSAMKALMYIRLRGWTDQTIFAGDIRPEDQQRVNCYFDAEKLSACILLGAREEYDRLLDLAFLDCRSSDKVNLDRMKAISAEILEVSVQAAGNDGVAVDTVETKVRVMEQLIHSDSAGEVVQLLNSLVYELMDEVQSRRVQKSKNAIDRAKSFMSMNLKDDIDLEDIAAHVYLSPNYFGSLFKREVGVSCVEYMTRLRVDYAKQLLETTQKSLQSISDEVGFRDSNYFSQVFKKAVGMPPSQYRRQTQEAYSNRKKQEKSDEFHQIKET